MSFRYNPVTGELDLFGTNVLKTLTEDTLDGGQVLDWVTTNEDILYTKAGQPALDLQFASSKSLTDAVSGQNLVDFTRASSGTYVGSDGLIATALTGVPRFDHDPDTGESLGLLIEEERTNLLLNSATLSTQNVTTIAVAHTLSFYGTGTVTLSGTHSATVVGTGAYPARTTLTFTPTAGTLTVTVSGTVQYANLEVGSFATSYISTTGAPATRDSETVSISGANFSSWYSPGPGTVFASVTAINYGIASSRIIQLGDGTGSNRHDLAGALLAFVNTAGVAQINGTTVNTVSNGNNARVSYGYDTNNFAWVLNGGTAQTSSSGTLPTVNQLGIGGRLDAAARLNGRMSRLVYFNSRLGNATLQAITT